MENNNLVEAMEKMLLVHEKAVEVFEADNLKVPKALLNEYKGKVSQYESMFQSLEDMKLLSSSEEGIAALTKQQIEVLRVRTEVEEELISKSQQYSL